MTAAECHAAAFDAKHRRPGVTGSGIKRPQTGRADAGLAPAPSRSGSAYALARLSCPNRTLQSAARASGERLAVAIAFTRPPARLKTSPMPREASRIQ
jgi:hypothetical protein